MSHIKIALIDDHTLFRSGIKALLSSVSGQGIESDFIGSWVSVALDGCTRYLLNPEGKPRVVRYGSVPGGSLDAESIAALAKLISVPGCSWNFTLSRGDYSLLVVQKPQVAKGELEQSVR